MTVQEAFKRLTQIAEETREVSDALKANVSVDTLRYDNDDERFSFYRVGDYEMTMEDDGTCRFDYSPIGDHMKIYERQNNVSMSIVDDVMLPPGIKKSLPQ